MNPAPDISVIISTYAIADYIARAVESALSQEGVMVEVIIVDDCSPDATWDVIKTLTDPRITAVRMEYNSGPSAARNRALSLARGRWIAVLDGDDSFLPGRLARMVALAHARLADIVVDNQVVYREADGSSVTMFSPAWFSKLSSLSLEQFIRSKLSWGARYSLGYLKPMISTQFLRRHAITYDTTIRVGEDYQLLADTLAYGGRCAVEPSAGYRYTIRKGSISYRIDAATIEGMMTADTRFMQRHTLSPAECAAQKQRAATHHDAWAYALLLAGMKQRSPRAVWRAFKSHPAAIRHLWEPVWVKVRRMITSRSAK